MYNSVYKRSNFIAPLMINIEGSEITTDEYSMLEDERVGGLILFTRNFISIPQIKQLILDVRNISRAPILVGIDHEGGRVQRFREGFSAIPAMGKLGQLYQHSQRSALLHAHRLGGLLASELAALDIDFSFTPVVDLSIGNENIIGDRSFHSNPNVVASLAKELMRGLHDAGMAAVAKHFPGHGFVSADSHLELPVDERSLDEIIEKDLVPFKALIDAGVEGVMPAHIVYRSIDPKPASFSKFWIQEILRKKLSFKGAVISDDLSMLGAAELGNPLKRAQTALQAGCDMLLLCNNPSVNTEVLTGLEVEIDCERSERLKRLMRTDSWDVLDFREHAITNADKTLSVFT